MTLSFLIGNPEKPGFASIQDRIQLLPFWLHAENVDEDSVGLFLLGSFVDGQDDISVALEILGTL